ncbi:MAG TPA: rhodanese-like domain-containing protein [Stellaceae bacterium]|nr:rhodanese-like domain-containing protein [Stellaceae bacterium]
MRNPLGRLFRKPAPAPRWVDVAGLRRLMAGEAAPLIVDVRGVDEFDGTLGHIEGARNIPLPELAAHAAEIAGAGQPVVCVCLTDKRSGAAAVQLAAAGIADVAVLRGGMTAWRDAG